VALPSFIGTPSAAMVGCYNQTRLIMEIILALEPIPQCSDHSIVPRRRFKILIIAAAVGMLVSLVKSNIYYTGTRALQIFQRVEERKRIVASTVRRWQKLLKLI
jgi:hypothetical protein